MAISIDTLKLMAEGTKTMAEWAAELGMGEGALRTQLGFMRRSGVAWAGKAIDGITTGRRQIGAVRVVKALANTGRNLAMRLGPRVIMGAGVAVVVVALFIYLGYSWYQWKHQPKPADETEVVEEPEPDSGKSGNRNFTDRPLRSDGNAGSFTPAGSTSTQPEPVKQHKLIELPSGVGKDEFISSAVKVVSGGPVSSLGARQISEQNQRELEQMQNREYEGFGAEWSNTPDLVWNPGPIPTVLKAVFKQDEDRNVTGWIWVARSRTKSPGGMEGFQCTKLKVTIGRVSGARGSEELNLDAGDGLVRGALYLTDKGKTIKGELNGSPVTLFRTY